jgi:hypothetical protein
MWIHHHEPESEHWSVECKQLVFPVKKEFRSWPTVGRVMLTLFLNSKRPVFGHFWERGVKMNSARYVEMLKNGLKMMV